MKNRTQLVTGLRTVNRTRLDIAAANRLAAKSDRSTDEILQDLISLLAAAVRQNKAMEV